MTDQLRWVKSSFSLGNGACVEVAPCGKAGVVLRHSKDESMRWLYYTWPEWAAFLDGATNGEFDEEVLLGRES